MRWRGAGAPLAASLLLARGCASARPGTPAVSRGHLRDLSAWRGREDPRRVLENGLYPRVGLTLVFMTLIYAVPPVEANAPRSAVCGACRGLRRSRPRVNKTGPCRVSRCRAPVLTRRSVRPSRLDSGWVSGCSENKSSWWWLRSSRGGRGRVRGVGSRICQAETQCWGGCLGSMELPRVSPRRPRPSCCRGQAVLAGVRTEVCVKLRAGGPLLCLLAAPLFQGHLTVTPVPWGAGCGLGPWGGKADWQVREGCVCGGVASQRLCVPFLA
ncbi:hypothetical protein HJG60_010717 [Phyllostomus discolor]|uniref:Uncharacterized protein n=1 Tax=Phyllostomus discolor TaxID=89673 RepID=A0A834EF36_9CHIR|nr:hypothetical protein HJG60_010717 [Phyllostomus discolor]